MAPPVHTLTTHGPPGRWGHKAGFIHPLVQGRVGSVSEALSSLISFGISFLSKRSFSCPVLLCFPSFEVRVQMLETGKSPVLKYLRGSE